MIEAAFFTCQGYEGIIELSQWPQPRTLDPTTGAAALKSHFCCLQDPATVLLKEFLPGTRPVALNELCVLIHLQGALPLRKWHAARATPNGQLPFVPLLGAQPCTLMHVWDGMYLSYRLVTGHQDEGIRVAPFCLSTSTSNWRW